MNITDELLAAYADNELDAATRAEVEAAVAHDPALAARVQAHRELRTRLSSAFDPVLDEHVPERLLAAANAPAKDTVIDLKQARQQRSVGPGMRWGLPQWAAIAASLLIGLFVGYSALQSGQAVVMRNGELVAAGALANALTNTLSGEESSVHHIGFSFRTGSGEYCRTFTSAGKQAIAGVACHEPEGWKVRAVTATQAVGSNYRMAASSMPPAVRAVVEESMQGEPLTVAEETAARARKWK